MKVSQILSEKRTFSFEFFPPREESQNLAFAQNLRDLIGLKPDFVSVTDTDYSTEKYKHLALSMLLKEKAGFDVILHLTCLNSTKKEIASMLKKAKEAGIENILALRGDKNPRCDILPGDFSYATDLLKETDLSYFCAGVAGHPEKHPCSPSMEKDIEILAIKKELGASYVITQLFYDNEKFFAYRDMLARKGINIPLLAGHMPLYSPSSLIKIEEKAGPISKPDSLLKIMEKYGDKKEDFFQASVDFSVKQCEELLKEGVKALHFFTFNKARAVKEIMKRISR